MKTAKKLILAAVILPLTLGTASAFAFGGKDHKKGHHGEFGFDRGIMRQLDLTDAQKEQMKVLRETSKTEMKAEFKQNFETRHAEMQANKEKLQALVLADTFDKVAANELAKQMIEQQTARKVKMLEKQHQMLSILTPEQKTKYVELQKERAEKRFNKMQERLSDS
ncbi:CpxP family protein [Vibrio sp. Isolate25]|uniref:CpxP family protein n=1 Tax=Vibrio sp. Isolate25 TaxID=2908535 RepID=UPI001EFEBF47|nr:CpxP family protein [Vibrio sp. Isolate25]MCG9599202.1 CpxP family protein [Vibrio sp. Isolate25]